MLEGVKKWKIRSLRQLRVRAILAIAGISLGAAILVALLSQTQGVREAVANELQKVGVSTIFIFPKTTTTKITDYDVLKIKTLPGVVHITPIILDYGKLYGAGEVKIVPIIGTDPTQMRLIAKGARIVEGKHIENVGEAVVGYNLVHPETGKPLVVLGKPITIEVIIKNKTREKRITRIINPTCNFLLIFCIIYLRYHGNY